MSSGPLAGVSSYPGRYAHVDEPVTELEALGGRPRDHWLELLHEADVPAAPVHTVDEVVQDPHVLDAGLLRQAVGPAGERFLVPRGAIAYAGDLDACSMEVPALGG